MRLCEIIKSDGKNYLRYLTDQSEEVETFGDNPAEFAESFLFIEGEPKDMGIRFTCTENTAWVVWAMAELKKRIHIGSLLNGEKEMEFYSNPESALRAVADIAFKKKTDFRMLMPFMQQYLQKDCVPDLDAAFRELKEKKFILEETGALSVGGAAIITALSFIHAMIALDVLEEKDKKQILTRAVYLNCYHSIWLMSPSDKDSSVLICSIGRRELKKDLESLFQSYR